MRLSLTLKMMVWSFKKVRRTLWKMILKWFYWSVLQEAETEDDGVELQEDLEDEMEKDFFNVMSAMMST